MTGASLVSNDVPAAMLMLVVAILLLPLAVPLIAWSVVLGAKLLEWWSKPRK